MRSDGWRKEAAHGFVAGRTDGRTRRLRLSGIYEEFASPLDGLIVRIRAEHGQSMKMIAHRGRASPPAPGTGRFDEIYPGLAMSGVLEIHGEHRKRKRRDTK